MRTLSATLLAAQKKPHRLPYVEAEVRDFEQGIKRLSWTRIYHGSEPENHHGIAFDGNGDMHRIRSEGSNLYYQKQTLPFGIPASFPLTFPIPLADPGSLDVWTQIATDCAGPCAIAASGTKVYIFYRSTSNVLRKHYSHNYGSTWTNAQLVAYADVLFMAACWWGTGNNVVCFALKATELCGIVLDTSTQTIVQQRTVSFTPPHTNIITATYGIGATYNPFWPQCEIVFAGRQSSTPYSHFNLFRTWFSDSYYFGSLESFVTVPDGEGLTYEYPDCHLPTSAQEYETNRITAVEKYTGTTAYTRPLTCHMVKGTYWGDTAFTEPRPFLNVPSSYGLRLQSTGDYWWLERPNGVWRAPRPAASPLVLTGDIVSLTQRISSRGLKGVGEGLVPSLTIELDNSKGQYNVGEGLVPSLINKRSEVVLKLGYKTTAGNEASEAGTYWIDGWEYSSKPNMSSFTLNCLDCWGLMDRWTARYQVRWNNGGASPRSVWQILYQLLARAGIKLTNTPAKPQSSAINNFQPDFIVNPGTQGDSAIRRLLSFVPDVLVFRGQEAFTKNPVATEVSCYSYGTAHPIAGGKYTDAVTGSWARAIGRDSGDNRILQEALDWDLLALAIDQLEQDYDPNLDDVTRTQERADAILRAEAMSAAKGSNLVVPTNVGQELLDVVEVTDKRCGISEENYRVGAIQTDYDRRKGRYEQTLTLGAP